MKKIITKDGSITYYSKKYQETYNSTTGAVEEAYKKFILPSKIKPGSRILDIGLGLGYNIACALKYSKGLTIISLERDPEVIQNLLTFEPPDELKEEYKIIKQFAKSGEYHDKDYNLILVLGDARETITSLNQKFDAVFLDPFSPPKNPELWDKEFLKRVYALMEPNGVLTTYSCAKKVRENLKDLGFKIIDGPRVKRRGPSTIAIKT